MRLMFEKIRFKNFGSYGNAWTEIKLNDVNTLFIGENGSGKSTLLDALCFVLFNKAFRDITKPELINDENGKDCRVEVWFTVGEQQFYVIRGMKPNIFEIYKNDRLVDQDAAARDYQTILEKNILKMNYQTFTQVVILGKASFIPFMQLRPAARREVIESIMDIGIYSSMLDLVKGKATEINASYFEQQKQSEIIKNNLEFLEGHLKSVKSDVNKKIQDQKEAIKTYEECILDFEKQKQEKQALWDELYESTLIKDDLDEKVSELRKYEAKIEHKIEACEHDIAFYNGADTCDRCKQAISPEFKEKSVSGLAVKEKALKEGLNDLMSQMGKLQARLGEITDIQKRLRFVQDNIQKIEGYISNHKRAKADAEKAIQELKQPGETMSDVKSKIDENKGKLSVFTDEMKKTIDRKYVNELSSTILKDSGVKASIIRKYIPVINKYVNKYLNAMNMFVGFSLDENFKETIRSKYKNDRSYASFSEGEKARMDIALLLTWRAVARLKNSVNTNLLIFDETFDGSLNQQGTDDLLKVLDALGKETNVIVISHKSAMIEKFAKVVKFEKVRDFSIMKEEQ